MKILDLTTIAGRDYPARRNTKNLVGGTSDVHLDEFSMGYTTLEPRGGQVPWHNHIQAEVYFIIDGVGEMCVGAECQIVHGGQMVYIPSNVYHQLTNLGETPLNMVYCYAPAGDVAHWKQELAGTLPKAGVDVPSLPEGAQAQIV